MTLPPPFPGGSRSENAGSGTGSPSSNSTASLRAPWASSGSTASCCRLNTAGRETRGRSRPYWKRYRRSTRAWRRSSSANAAAAGVINAASADGDCAEAYRLVAASGTPLAFQAYAHPSESALPRAEPHGEGAVLSGVAGYIVNGGIADLALIPAEGPGGVSYYLVDLWQTAVSLSMPVFSLGMRACPAVDATLAGAAGTPVGLPGRGVSYFERMRERLSAASAAILVGIMKGSFEDALAYARERFQGDGRSSTGPRSACCSRA